MWDVIQIWGKEKIQEQLNKTYKNADVFALLNAKFNESGFNRTSEQCCFKVKKINKIKVCQQYLKIRDELPKTSSSIDVKKEVHEV